MNLPLHFGRCFVRWVLEVAMMLALTFLGLWVISIAWYVVLSGVFGWGMLGYVVLNMAFAAVMGRYVWWRWQKTKRRPMI